MRTLLLALPVVLLALAYAPAASAAEPLLGLPDAQPAPDNALELTIAGGYASAPATYAGLHPGSASDGVAFEGAALWRRSRRAIGLTLDYADLSLGEGARIRSGKVALLFGYHFRPSSSIDPWAGWSSGLRWAAATDASAFGFEAARLHAGLDLRATSLVAIGPVASVGCDVFPWEHHTPPFYVTAFLGIGARFDVVRAVVDD